MDCILYHNPSQQHKNTGGKPLTSPKTNLVITEVEAQVFPNVPVRQ
jgi:hypothetical protein